jgi:hypothetical protein
VSGRGVHNLANAVNVKLDIFLIEDKTLKKTVKQTKKGLFRKYNVTCQTLLR